MVKKYISIHGGACLMMGKKDLLGRDQFQMVTLNSLVPQNHIVRKIDTAVSSFARTDSYELIR